MNLAQIRIQTRLRKEEKKKENLVGPLLFISAHQENSPARPNSHAGASALLLAIGPQWPVSLPRARSFLRLLTCGPV